MSVSSDPQPALDLSAAPPEAGDYEIYVQVVEGPHKGTIGYVDDEGEEDGEHVAYVYPKVWMSGPYIVVPYRMLLTATPVQQEWYQSRFEQWTKEA